MAEDAPRMAAEPLARLTAGSFASMVRVYRKGSDMNRYAIRLLAAFTLLVASSAAAFAAGPQPKVVIPEVKQVFGTVVEGEPVVREFALRNEGDAPLILERVATG